MVKVQRYYDIIVGTYGSAKEAAIEWLLFDSKEGTLEKVGAVSGIESPSFLTVNRAGKRLYAVSEVENGEAACFEVDFTNKALREINRQSTGGASPCYISLSPNDQWLFTANYSGGNVAVHPLKENGEIDPICDLKNYAQPSTQDKVSHPHTIINIPGTEKYIVADLGLDRLYLYDFDAGIAKLVLVNEIPAVEGSGPRHIAIHPLSRMIYVSNEYHSTISVYSYDEKVELFKFEQQVETIPTCFDGTNDCADIHITPSGSHLYASNRGHHSIVSYEIRQDGKLRLLDYSSTNGEWPRNFAVVPNEAYILAANEHSNSIAVMKTGDDGIPKATGYVYNINSPVCLYVH